MCGSLKLLPLLAVIFTIASIILQLISLPSTYWGEFNNKADYGKSSELGHYGLWSVCSTKAPHWTESCNPLDSLFQLPTYAVASGAVGVIHLLLIALALLPLSSIRLLQVLRGKQNYILKAKKIGFWKITVAFVSVVLDILICALASVGESRFKDYEVRKSYAFWIQVSELILDLLLSLICALENIQLWQLDSLETPNDDYETTYGNPNYENDSPTGVRRTVYMTDTSGIPYSDVTSDHSAPSYRSNNLVHNQPFSRSREDLESVRSKNGATVIKISNGISYENRAFEERTPPPTRRKRREKIYDSN